MKKLVFLFALVMVFAVLVGFMASSAYAQDLTPDGDLTVTDPIVIVVEPTVQYVLQNINMGEVAKILRYGEAINEGKEEFTRGVRRTSRIINEIEAAYAEIEADEETAALHEAIVAIVKNHRDDGNIIVDQLDNTWSQYNA